MACAMAAGVVATNRGALPAAVGTALVIPARALALAVNRDLLARAFGRDQRRNGRCPSGIGAAVQECFTGNGGAAQTEQPLDEGAPVSGDREPFDERIETPVVHGLPPSVLFPRDQAPHAVTQWVGGSSGVQN